MKEIYSKGMKSLGSQRFEVLGPDEPPGKAMSTPLNLGVTGRKGSMLQ